MKKLLENSSKFYTPKKRPSGHDISDSFKADNGGAIPSNLLQIPNTDSNSQYLNYCKILNINAHPARFPSALPEFFIKLLTDENDLVLDIFAGSNTTGWVAQSLNRSWLSFELERQYLAASAFRFLVNLTQDTAVSIHQSFLEDSNAQIRLENDLCFPAIDKPFEIITDPYNGKVVAVRQSNLFDTIEV
jgi:site-specific DNA-methyltransferase (cytosine-N4-specific)